MRVFSTTFVDGGELPYRSFFGSFAAVGKLRLDQNLNPHIGWDDLPAGTRSLALHCDDLDVPLTLTPARWMGIEPLPEGGRQSFCHWLLIDLLPEGPHLAEGEFSDGVYVGGKPGPQGPRGTRQGFNALTDGFRHDSLLAGDYFGYDGAAPPAFDALAHRYVFRLYALDVRKLEIPERFGVDEFKIAIEGHVLDSTAMTGLAKSRLLDERVSGEAYVAAE